MRANPHVASTMGALEALNFTSIKFSEFTSHVLMNCGGLRNQQFGPRTQQTKLLQTETETSQLRIHLCPYWLKEKKHQEVVGHTSKTK